ncbi:diguanylate cyclase [Desulfocurvibacter africanus]|uniref:diguanylate cyclase n=1 Tax=Desulfocurvibacter africanus subsp. africanus str. Walvis Bay TaxID=690850 RepID=F3Z1F3_DESAF|nr:diguanylate cyclase [Desulfocurvibacter africanus]EGJ49984.1 response regulator receiver modulated diguanylate cyclase [Desulfocurvibacter africanus subsp. africanus str. Walvis Bay]
MQSLELKEFLARQAVLYVEDDAIIQFSVSTLLDKVIGRLYTASDGQEGLDIFLEKRPDIVITDIRVPGMTGLEMVEAIRERDKDVPIIVTTAYNETDNLLRAIELGIDKYVVKPIERGQLLQCVERCAEGLRQRRQVEEANRYNRFLLDINPNFMVTFESGRIEYVNKTFLEFIGFGSMEELLRSGRQLHEWMLSVDDVQDPEALEGWQDLVIRGHDRDVLVTFRSGDSDVESRAFLATSNRLPDSPKYVLCFTDVTRLESEKRGLIYKASTDHLTGAMNRMSFQEFLSEEMKRATRYGTPLSVAMFDIDDFKRINDELGHDAGDRVLVGLVKLVEANIRELDRLARWGGEEFMLLAPGCGPEEMAKLGEKLRALIESGQPGGVGRVTCSFGVSDFAPGDTGADLLRRADEALYLAKRRGKNTVTTL